MKIEDLKIHRNTEVKQITFDYILIRCNDELDIHVSVHHDIIYESDQQDATV